MRAKKRPEKTAAQLRKIASDALKEGRTLAQRNADLVKRLEALSELVEQHLLGQEVAPLVGPTMIEEIKRVAGEMVDRLDLTPGERVFAKAEGMQLIGMWGNVRGSHMKSSLRARAIVAAFAFALQAVEEGLQRGRALGPTTGR